MSSATPQPLSMQTDSQFTIIIPAHNEEPVLERCLSALRRGAPAGARPDIIIVANGCTDRTVEVARRAAPDAVVIDLAEGSKPKATNVGLQAAKRWPCLVLDADIVVDYLSLSATAAVLSKSDGKIAIASPTLRLDLEEVDRFVRSYYTVWVTQPYVRKSMVGSGLYGISADAYAEIGNLPDTFADDDWLRTRFAEDRRCSVASTEAGDPVFFLMRPPRTLVAQIRVEARRMRAVSEMRRQHPSAHTTRNNHFSNLSDARANGASYADIAIYLAMKAAVRLLMRYQSFRGKGRTWTRDRAGVRQKEL